MDKKEILRMIREDWQKIENIRADYEQYCLDDEENEYDNDLNVALEDLHSTVTLIMEKTGQ